MKYPILIPIALLLLSSCNQAEMEKSNNEKDSLRSVITAREELITAQLSSFNDVERNLDSISIKQNIILQNTNLHSDLKLNQKERINAEIISINNLMEENRKKIGELTHKIKTSAKKNAQLEETIAILNAQLARKYDELTTLNEKLLAVNGEVEKLKISVDTLTVQNTIKSEIITSKTDELHTAYYVVNKTKELQNEDLIGKTGGLLGIGRISKLNENFNNNKFTRIDYTKTKKIAINSESAKIISSHPLDSYTLEKENKLIKNLLITDPEKFWSISKYLVIAND